MDEGGDGRRFKYPYLPFATFIDVLDRMRQSGVPERVDRDFLSYTSGVMQSYLLAMLKGFGLIDENNYRTGTLEWLAHNPDARSGFVGDLLREHYKEQLALGPDATPEMLEETFAPLQGDTKRKAITFFLHAVKFADIPVSPRFKARRSSSGGAPRKAAGRRPEETDDGQRPGDSYTIVLGSGVEVSLLVSERLLSLDRDDRDFILHLVDEMQERAATGHHEPDGYRAD
ncbi:MAG TPA: DUF5343 domain-containing protein [Actinomycetota bacterium]|nr:DUF5343 domain-containing protein [Actinomycetota bacterium]